VTVLSDVVISSCYELGVGIPVMNLLFLVVMNLLFLVVMNLLLRQIILGETYDLYLLSSHQYLNLKSSTLASENPFELKKNLTNSL
jgi:hypothetical protein